MSRRQRHIAPTKAGWSLIASVMAHVSLLSVAGLIAYHFSQARERREVESRTAPPTDVVAIELPTFAEGTLVTDHEVVPEGEVPAAHGGSTVARVDTGNLGRGGQNTGPRAINLAAVDEDLSLSPDLTSRLDRDQHQRLKTTATLRTTREDRRATTHPMELTFLATGTGEHQERRPSAPSDPSRGSLVAPRPAAVLGGHAGTRESDDVEGPGATAGASRPGQLMASPGVGVRAGEAGTVHSAAARVALGRPSVAEGPPTITAAFRGRPNDTVDSDQEVASIVQSQVHASFAGGLAGAGRGGSNGPGADPGAGGTQGRGSIARALGSGDGEVFDWYTNDPMLLPYFRKIHAKVDPLWRDAFPRSALLELKQGTVILEFTIAADGSVKVSWPPARPSGIDEFDKNCAEAIRRAGPFEPIPAALREMGRSSLHIRAPFVAKNPIVK
ncbi:MAG TPA: TonB family protein [Labilithrix sp.]|nr:TonB family protein [Labilithrix sp.]